jgi:hypothetical protein
MNADSRQAKKRTIHPIQAITRSYSQGVVEGIRIAIQALRGSGQHEAADILKDEKQKAKQLDALIQTADPLTLELATDEALDEIFRETGITDPRKRTDANQPDQIQKTVH